MPNQKLNRQYAEYVADQVYRIQSFKKLYEVDQGSPIGSYPFAIRNRDHVFPVPTVQYYNPIYEHGYHLIECDLHNRIISESASMDSKPTDEGNTSFIHSVTDHQQPVDDLTNQLIQSGDAQSIDQAHLQIMDVLAKRQGKDTYTLERIKQLTRDGVSLTLAPSVVPLQPVLDELRVSDVPSKRVEALPDTDRKLLKSIVRTSHYISSPTRSSKSSPGPEL